MASRTFLFGAALALVTLVACSSGRDGNTDEAEGELRRAGQTCGGARNAKCRSDLKCIIEENEGRTGLPPGVMGMPVMPREEDGGGASNGPPPGANGMPILPQEATGKCVSCWGAWTDEFGTCRSPADGVYPRGCCEAAANVVPGSFKLYREPNADVNEMCDMHTTLKLTAAGDATLDHAVGGACEIMASPDPRTYRLKLVDEPCGSKAYEGERRAGDEVHTIKLVDHRSRLCRDLQPAKIIVEEKRGEETRTLYSKDF